MKLLPITKLGMWSLGLFIIALLAFVFMQIMVMSGQTGGEKFSDNLLLAIPGFTAGISAITAGAIGAVSIWKYKERSSFIYVITAIGLLVLVFLVGEFSSAH